MEARFSWAKMYESATLLGTLRLRNMQSGASLKLKELVDMLGQQLSMWQHRAQNLERPWRCVAMKWPFVLHCGFLDCNRHLVAIKTEYLGGIFCNRPKIDKWMQDWLIKQHPAPDYSVQHPKSRAFILRLYICENYAKNRLLLTAKKKTSCFCMLFLQNHIFVCSRLLWAASCGSAKILQFPQKRLLVSDSIVVHSCCLREEF